MALYSGSIPTEYCYKHHLNVVTQITQEPLHSLFLNSSNKKSTVNIITVLLKPIMGNDVLNLQEQAVGFVLGMVLPNKAQFFDKLSQGGIVFRRHIDAD